MSDKITALDARNRVSALKSELNALKAKIWELTCTLTIQEREGGVSDEDMQIAEAARYARDMWNSLR